MCLGVCFLCYIGNVGLCICMYMYVLINGRGRSRGFMVLWDGETEQRTDGNERHLSWDGMIAFTAERNRENRENREEKMRKGGG